MRSISQISSTSKVIAGVGMAAVMGLTLSACGGSSTAATPKPVAQITHLTGKSTAVKLDAGFVKALTTLKLTPGVTGTAKLTKGGSVVFPITGGNVTYYKPGSISPYVTGDIEHNGSGLSLTAGKTVVKLTNFAINPGNSRLYGDVSLNGKSQGKHVFIFQLDGHTLKPLKTGPNNTAILTGTKVEISSAAAPLLDKVFHTTAVKAGLLVGIATITVNTK